MKPCNLFRSLALSLLIGSASLAVAQPGTAIAESAVSADIVTLFARAAQVYPAVFINGTGWYSYSGFTYKYFPAGGIYAGVKDGQVYLMGGAYGNNPSMKGTVTQLSAALQNAITAAASGGSNGGSSGSTTNADFGNVLVFKTTADLPKYFDEMTIESTAISGATTITATMKMERVGAETLNGVVTERMKVTMTTSGGSSVNDLWVDSAGTVRRYIANGFEYTNAATADLLGRSLVSSMVSLLAAADSASIKNATSVALSNTTALQSKVQKRTFNGQQVDTLILTINVSIINYSVEISDFGNFSMITNYDATTTGIGSNKYRLVSLTPR